MKELSFFGYSDDCRDIEGIIDDEDYHPAVKIMASDGTGLYVVWSYSEVINNGCWMVGFQQLDEDIPIPDWASNIRLTTVPHGYSVRVSILIDDDTDLEFTHEWHESKQSDW